MEFENLKSQLEADDPAERAYAAEDLVTLNDFRAISVLIDHLISEKSIQVRETIFSALKSLYQSIVEPIGPLLYSDDAQLRNGAVNLLNEAEKSTISFLDRLSHDSDKDVRKFVLDALKGKKTAAAISIIRDRLEDEEINIRMTAVEYLGDLEDEDSALEIVGILKNADSLMLEATCFEALAKMNHASAAIEALDLYQDIKGIQPMLLFSYLKLLRSVGTVSHLEIVESLLEEKKDLCAKEIIDVLEGIHRREPLKTLPATLRNLLFERMENPTHPAMVFQIMTFLFDVEKEEMLEFARSKLKMDDPLILMAVFEYLEQYGTPDDISAIKNTADRIEDEELQEKMDDVLENINVRYQNGDDV